MGVSTKNIIVQDGSGRNRTPMYSINGINYYSGFLLANVWSITPKPMIATPQPKGTNVLVTSLQKPQPSSHSG